MYETVLQRWLLDEKLPDSWWVSLDGSVLDDKKSLQEIRLLAKEHDSLLVTHAETKSGSDPIWQTYEKDPLPEFPTQELESYFHHWCLSQEAVWLKNLESTVLTQLTQDLEKRLNAGLPEVINSAVQQTLPDFIGNHVDEIRERVEKKSNTLIEKHENTLSEFQKNQFEHFEKELRDAIEQLHKTLTKENISFAKENFSPQLVPVIENLWKEHLEELSRTTTEQVLAQTEVPLHQFLEEQKEVISNKLLQKAEENLQGKLPSLLSETVSHHLASLAPQLSEELFSQVKTKIKEQESKLQKAIERFSNAPPWKSAEPPIL